MAVNAAKSPAKWFGEEVADFLAARPSVEQILAYRPSTRASRRLNALLLMAKAGNLNADERWELNQFEHLELLMQSIKAKLRTGQPVST